MGVARQYCGQLGKRANCQSLVSLTLAQGEVPVPVSLRLFLPDEWVADPQRCARAGVPEAEVEARAKGEVALAELDRVVAAGARFGCVLADAGYRTSAAFRHALDERGLLWAVGIAKNQKVYGKDVRLVPPTYRARKPVPDQEPRAVEDVLAALPWRRVKWRHGTIAEGDPSERRTAKPSPGQARRPVCGRPHPGCRRRGVGQQSSPAGPRSVAGRRMALLGRAQVLPQQPAAPYVRARPGRCHQGALGVRAGAPADQGRAGTGAIRGPLLDGPAPARAHDLHRLRLPATPAPRRTELDGAGQKCIPTFRDRHHRQACPRCAGPLSPSRPR